MSATPTVQDELSGFFRADPRYLQWPYEMFHRWQEGLGAVHWDDGPALVVTRYQDVKTVMSGSLPLGNNAYRYGKLADGTIAKLPLALHEPVMEILDFEGLFMSRNNGADHTRLRRIASRAFTSRRMSLLRDSIERHVDELLDDLVDRGVGDYQTEFANLLPVRVITDLIGVPESDRQLIWGWSQAVAEFFSIDAGSVEKATDAVAAFREYIESMIERIKRTGEGHELAKLLLGGHEEEVLSSDELVAMYLVLLFGGSETTTNLLGNGFLALQRNPEQWNMLVQDPSLVRGAVEEMFRYDSPHQYLPRHVQQDMEIAGVQLRKDDSLIIVHAAANRDETVFEEPDRFDITRSNAREHLSLAFGPHHCLGAALARLEGDIVFTKLATRLPKIRITTDNVEYGGSAMLRAIRSMPVNVGATASS
ncbi:cytochrome P450 [Rhodococcus fascians]|nr:cytochrome P450 [Rhodococcus fascians]MBY4238742.1 cytochrome P450 [Rhodococcus fascians]MBY4254669.1 cytochrome P450 [Rhodococcus fascians]MBY4270097.1 cytochrome P450 [Rhodococcus fascians]